MLLEQGRRTATVRIPTDCRIVSYPAAELSTGDLRDLATVTTAKTSSSNSVQPAGDGSDVCSCVCSFFGSPAAGFMLAIIGSPGDHRRVLYLAGAG